MDLELVKEPPFEIKVVGNKKPKKEPEWVEEAEEGPPDLLIHSAEIIDDASALLAALSTERLKRHYSKHQVKELLKIRNRMERFLQEWRFEE